MAAIDIGIDLCPNPLCAGHNLRGVVLLERGSKGINWSDFYKKVGAPAGPFAASRIEYGDDDDDDDDGDDPKQGFFPKHKSPAHAVDAPEFFDCLRDAHEIAKSQFGSPNIRSAVVVVPNADAFRSLKAIRDAGSRAHIGIQQIVPEYVAVAAAYADKERPTEIDHKITVISSSAGFHEVCVVTMTKEVNGYKYRLVKRESSQVSQGGGGGGGATSGLPHLGGVLGYVTTAFNPQNVVSEATPFTTAIEMQLSEILDKFRDKSGTDRVVFVGKESAEIEKKRQMLRGFGHVKEWKEIHDSEKVAAYGAAVLASLRKEVIYEED